MQAWPGAQSEAATQPMGHAEALPEHRSAPGHAGPPGDPASRGTQEPLLQSPHGPHAESQQIPPTHWVDWHWFAAVQPNPFASVAMQRPASQ